jgi:glycosyltransferase involved in cell wall biosynthesis
MPGFWDMPTECQERNVHQPLTILYVSHTPFWGGGGEVSLQTLIRAVREAGYRPFLVCPPGTLAERLRAHCEIITVPMPWLERSQNPGHQISMMAGWVASTYRLTRILQQVQPDIVHANSGVSALISGVACALARRPLIWHQHDVVPPRPINRIVLGVVSRLCSTILATSSAVARSLEALGIAPERIRVFYPSVRAEILRDGPPRDRARAELGISSDAAVITVIGRLVARKGQDVVLAALPHLNAAANLCVLLVGAAQATPTGEPEEVAYLDRLHRLAERPALAGHVRFLGHRDDIGTILAVSDLFVMPSHNEPLGIVILEAFAARVPVIAARAGGPLEVIEDGVDGMLVPPGDPVALAEACNRFCADAALRARLAEAARSKVEAEFNEVSVITRLADIYADVLRLGQQEHREAMASGEGQRA